MPSREPFRCLWNLSVAESIGRRRKLSPLGWLASPDHPNSPATALSASCYPSRRPTLAQSGVRFWDPRNPLGVPLNWSEGPIADYHTRVRRALPISLVSSRRDAFSLSAGLLFRGSCSNPSIHWGGVSLPLGKAFRQWKPRGDQLTASPSKFIAPLQQFICHLNRSAMTSHNAIGDRQAQLRDQLLVEELLKILPGSWDQSPNRCSPIRTRPRGTQECER